MPAPRLPSAAAFKPHPTRRWLGWAGMGLGTAVVALWLARPAGESVTLTAKTWQRDIEIETLVDDFGSGWCDELPLEARVSHRALMSDPSGQRSVPTEHCRYTAPQWRALHSAHAEGRHPTLPAWPKPKLAAGSAPPKLGDERVGKRHERYEIELRAASGKTWTCRLPQAKWQDLTPGMQFQLRTDRFGVGHCDSLPLGPPAASALSPRTGL